MEGACSSRSSCRNLIYAGCLGQPRTEHISLASLATCSRGNCCPNSCTLGENAQDTHKAQRAQRLKNVHALLDTVSKSGKQENGVPYFPQILNINNTGHCARA